MHTGADAQGSHYLMYVWATAAEAAAALPHADAAPFRKAIREHLLKCRTEEGSFVDNPILGPNAATALALRTLYLLDHRALK
jgi:hypothetical protein